MPAYPGMEWVLGSQPDSTATSTTPSRGPTLAGFYAYVVEAPYEDVIAYYAKQLHQPARAAAPKDLPRLFPAQPIPGQSHGRRSMFRIGTLGPAQASEPFDQRVLQTVLGSTDVVVSDFFVDPATHQLSGRTSIVVLQYR